MKLCNCINYLLRITLRVSSRCLRVRSKSKGRNVSSETPTPTPCLNTELLGALEHPTVCCIPLHVICIQRHACRYTGPTDPKSDLLTKHLSRRTTPCLCALHHHQQATSVAPVHHLYNFFMDADTSGLRRVFKYRR